MTKNGSPKNGGLTMMKTSMEDRLHAAARALANRAANRQDNKHHRTRYGPIY